MAATTIRSEDLQHMSAAVSGGDVLTERQRTIAFLIARYYEAAHELPSYGWLSRRLNISRQRARASVENLQRKGWCLPR